MKFKTMRFSVPLIVTVFAVRAANVTAAEPTFEYPELSVVPRASERLQSEVNREREQGWRTELPFLVPAATSIASGLVLLGSGTRRKNGHLEAQYAPWVGIGVGAAWAAISLLILDQPGIYEEGMKTVAALPKGTQREQLARERRAEEALFHAGSVARRVKWLSVASQVGAGAFMAMSAQKNSAGLYAGLASAAVAFTPVIFPHSWERNAKLHRDYKKHICTRRGRDIPAGS